MAHFFPDAQRVADARLGLARGHYGDLDIMMGIRELPRPSEGDLPRVIAEFSALASELGLTEAGTAGFVVLVPVMGSQQMLTTPVLVDIERQELAFTSHPEFGASVIPGEVISSNTELGVDVREQLIGVLATWHNAALAEEEG